MRGAALRLRSCHKFNLRGTAMTGKFRSALIVTTMFTALAGPASAAVVSSNTTVQTIADNSTISSIINIGTHGTVGSLDISVAVGHTWVGDLIYQLVHGGTTVTLMDRPGNFGSVFGNSTNLSADHPLTFSDSALVAAETIGADCNNNQTIGIPNVCRNTLFIPEQALGAFTGSDVFGDWILKISDNAGGDTGQLANWSLTANVRSSVPEPGSLALLGLALGGVAVFRRKRVASN